jgi:membrane-associated protease RseP (regulator of RpoE activity)
MDNVQVETYEEFTDFMSNTSPGDNVTLGTDNGEFPVTLAGGDDDNKGILGVLTVSAQSGTEFFNPLNILGSSVGVVLGGSVFHPYAYDALAPWVIIDVLKWLFALNLLVGFFNLLPAKPLDGGYIFEALLERKVSHDRAKKITKVFSYIVLVLIILNLVPSLRGLLG